MSFGEAEKENGGFLLGWVGVGVGTHRDLESPISVSAHWDHFQRPQAAPIYRLWASWEVYYGLAPGFPDSSRGPSSGLPFLCHRYNQSRSLTP